MLSDHPFEAAISRLAGVLQQGLGPPYPMVWSSFSESVSRNIGAAPTCGRLAPSPTCRKSPPRVRLSPCVTTRSRVIQPAVYVAVAVAQLRADDESRQLP